jgi:hypothetical protein
MNPMIQFKAAILTFFTSLACFALSPTAQAQGCPSLCGNNHNTAEGLDALISLTSGVNNTAIGEAALDKNTTGNSNTAIGLDALFSNTTGNSNTATGVLALVNNNADNNTADGDRALQQNTTGTNNTATGQAALELNTIGNNNTANGVNALINNTTGNNNTATGESALEHNINGSNNTANGFFALFNNTSGGDNIAIGDSALFTNTTGGGNTVIGDSALGHNTIGNQNTATGVLALLNNTTGSGNIALGYNAGSKLTTGSNNIDIGANVLGNAGEANIIRIGKVGTQTKTFIAGIHGVTVANTLQVVVDVNGHLGTVGSSERFKEAIRPMDKTSEAILALKPVTFRYKEEIDPDKAPQFGLIAEEVEKVNPDLVARDDEGKPYTVRYEAVNAMLLNEFLKEHHTVQELKATVAQQQKQIEALTARLEPATISSNSIKLREN